jgi:3-(3-hydroxy-phenyl)propionate hydroxylase
MAPDADPAEVSKPEVARERVVAMLGPQQSFELVWVGPYAYRTMLMEKFRHGRLLFIGDAAHAKSPFGGRGGNSGIMDADNLGWKLALVQGGHVDAAVLDTYNEERHRAAVENIRITSRTGRFLRPRNEAEFVWRTAVLRLARRHAFACTLLDTGRMCTPHRYAGLSAFGSGPLDGKSVPNIALLQGGRACGLIDVLRESGTAPTALAFGASAEQADTLAAAAHAAMLPLRVCIVGAELIDVHGLLAAETGARRPNIALLRPDSHLAAVLKNADPAPLLEALRRTFGDAAGPGTATRFAATEIAP